MINMSSPKQTIYVFAPGKNWKLSLAELVSFFKARKFKFEIVGLSKSFFVIASEGPLNPSIIDDLGGVIKIGRGISCIPLKTVENAFLRRKKQARTDIKTYLSADHATNEIFETPLEKFTFGVSLYFENSRFLRFSREAQRFLGSYFKEELAAQGKKANFMGFPKDREMPQLTHVEVLKKNLIEKSAEILFCIGKNQAFISKTIAVHNPFEFQKRDIDRPVQRRIFSIPPRLAKIMVNLASCLPGNILLDPFCGVGTILQEAMLLKAKVLGIDINPWCVKASCSNLEWLKQQYDLDRADYTVLLGDARRLTNQICKESVDCVVSEPDLGPPLRHFPTESYAKRIVNTLEPLYWDFLEETYKVLKDGGRLVVVAPYVKARNGAPVHLNINERAMTLGFKVSRIFRKGFFVEDSLLIENLAMTASFVDVEQRHKIGREIHILQK